VAAVAQLDMAELEVMAQITATAPMVVVMALGEAVLVEARLQPMAGVDSLDTVKFSGLNDVQTGI
jgi:hypothetical protein